MDNSHEQSNFLIHAQLYGARKLEFVINWNPSIKIDTIYFFLVDKTSGANVNIFLNPSEKEFYSELDFYPGSFKHIIHIYGLATRETENGRFYQLSGHSQRNLKVAAEDLSDVRVIFNVKETANFSLPLKDKCDDRLDVKIVRSPPASYTITAESMEGNPYMFIIFLKQLHHVFVFIQNTINLKLALPLELESGTWSEFQVLCTRQHGGIKNKYMTTKTLYHSEKIKFKTYLSKEDLKSLYHMALEYIANSGKGNQMKPIQYFYRNKSKEYYRSILASSSGEMKPYLKDCNGDQGSIINGAIHGLFYSTFLGSRFNPPPVSYYGPVRLHIKALSMLREHCNVYFSDFYCHYEKHYVTIVMNHHGSPEDIFCEKYLLKLDKYDNPFLKLDKLPNKHPHVMANQTVIVEVFYTETVNVLYVLQQGLGYLSKTMVMGRGQSKPEGIPKNEECKKCNLSKCK